MIAAKCWASSRSGWPARREFFDIAMTRTRRSRTGRAGPQRKQLRYASTTAYLEGLAECLHGELRERGRAEWHRESCRAMVDAAGRDRPDESDEAWRIKGAGRLTHRQLAYLREIWGWRDMRARRSDRPTFKVLGNRQLLELVQWTEGHPDEPLDKGPKLPRNFVGSWRRTLQQAIARAAALTPGEWPKRRGTVVVKPPPRKPSSAPARRVGAARGPGDRASMLPPRRRWRHRPTA